MGDYETFKRSAIRDQDDIKTCPYNSSHAILESRLQYHLAKCAKQHAQKDILICPYNATHHIPGPLMLDHTTKECPDRKNLECFKFHCDDEVGEKHLSEYKPPPLPPSDENWDDEEVQSTYEPEKHLSNKCVFRNLQGASKSERKKFRQEERRRIAQLSPENAEAPKVNSPLRPPKSLPMAMQALELDSRLGMGRGAPVHMPEEKSTSEWQVVGKKKGVASHQRNSAKSQNEAKQTAVARGRGIWTDTETKVGNTGTAKGHTKAPHY